LTSTVAAWNRRGKEYGMGFHRRLVVGAAVVTVAGVAGIAGIVSADGRPLSTDLSGAEEAPGPGDADATGAADLTLNQGQGEVCFDLSWAQIDGTVVAAHIHEAPAGVPGPIVVPLFEGALAGTDSASDCVDVEKSLVKDIRKHPADYYVNVHSTPGFEAGAIRGQLSK
jgi:CHRD domain